MKILILNTSDMQGGAARAAFRLHKSLLNAHVDSQMLVQDKSSDHCTIIGENNKLLKYFNKIRPIIDSLPIKISKHKSKTFFSLSWFGFSNIIAKINKINPDIVHLHWVNGGMLKIEDLLKIKQPIIWTMHDNWLFTGGCHIMWHCKKYKIKCGSCHVLGSNKKKDLSTFLFFRKQKIFSKLKNMTTVSPSHWLADCAKESVLLSSKKNIVIPNPLDTNIYKPINKQIAREILNISKDKKIILFGAMSATSDINKGFDKLYKALEKVENKNIELLIFGASEPKKSQNFKFKTRYFNHVHDDYTLALLYSSSDVMIVPSLQENLPNTILESLSCGTPVVAFNIGGNSDMINHYQNGYLAKPYNIADLANGIEWILNSKNYDELCKNARDEALKKFSSEVVAGKYIKLYEKVLQNSFLNA